MNAETHSSPGLARRVLNNPIARFLVLGFLLVALMAMSGDVQQAFADNPKRVLAHVVSLALAGAALYIGYARLIEQREATELAPSAMARNLAIGILVGSGLYTASVLILMALGIYRIEGLNPVSFLWTATGMAVSSAVFEELLFRGVVFICVERLLGSWVALVVSSLLFGMVHLMNPEGTMEGALFIAVEAGILLAGAYMLTRSLWMSMGFHFSWNYTQSGIFSGIVSGNEPAQGLFKSSISGPDLLTGGSFGLESSVVALVLCTTTGIILVALAAKRGNIVPPIWKRKP